MSLREWSENRWLADHAPSAEEIASLLAVVDRDVEDAAIHQLSADRRMGIAYNAALQLATLALAAEGYRPGRERAHERAIQSLQFTVGLDLRLVHTLDGIRRKRNMLDYERAGTTSPSEAEEVYRIVIELNARVRGWLSERHPELMPPDDMWGV